MINTVPLVVGTGAQPGGINIYLGMTSDDLLLDQHSWQAEMGVPGCRDATGSSGQTAQRSANIPFYEREGVAYGWKLRVSCGLVSHFNSRARG